MPPGDYQLRIFHERALPENLQFLERRITVPASGLALPLISISETGFIPAPHLNKYGQALPARLPTTAPIRERPSDAIRFSRLSLLSKILLSTSVALTVLFAITGRDRARATSPRPCRTACRKRCGQLSGLHLAVEVARRAAVKVSRLHERHVGCPRGVRHGDQATIRDTAGELWSKISDSNAIFLVTDPRGKVIASLGGVTAPSLRAEPGDGAEPPRRGFPSRPPASSAAEPASCTRSP